MKKLLYIFSVLLLLSMVTVPVVSAQTDASMLEDRVAYSYNYDYAGNAIKTPPFYEPDGEFTGEFSTAVDMITYNNKLYVLTSDGIDIYDLTSKTHQGKIISDAVNFADAKGFYISKDEKVFITQYEGKKVVVITMDGQKSFEIGEPQSALISKDFVYKPLRVAVQENGLIYVVSEGAYDGLIQFDSNGNFISFFGANKVTMTAELLLQQFWNKYRTEEQKERTINALPTNYSSLCIGENDLLYVCSDSQELESAQIKKLSPYGNDVTPTSYSNVFGDIGEGKDSKNAFSDLAVDENGIITALDAKTGKIFQYDSVNHLLGVFGGFSDQKGTFSKPVAIEVSGDKVWVLDIEKNAILIFKPTSYGSLLRNGSTLYLNGRIQEAVTYFEKVVKTNSNLDWVLSGLGQAALEKEEYEKGMYYFKAAMDTDGYNQCFEAYRTDIISRYFWIIFVAVAVLFAVIWILMTKATNKEEKTVYELKKFKVKPWYVLAHPTVFSEIKYMNRGSLLYSVFVLISALLTRICELSLKGFLYNPDRGLENNYISETVQFFLIFICFVACVWAVGTFLEGKGKLKDLIIGYSYALVPYVICGVFSIILSNVMTLREAVFVTGIQTLGIIWSALLFFIVTMQLNEYSFGKTIISIILTLFAIVFVLFVLVLMATLIGKVTSFVSQVVEEIKYKL